MLKKNDIIDIVSIGTPCTFLENEKIKKFLKENGLEPRIFLEKEVSIAKTQTHEFATISAKTRFEHFKKAINSNSKIIWCSRGGYGSAEILPFLQKMPKPKKPKILIGFSDITSVANFLSEKWGWQIISAPMLAQFILNKVSKKSEAAIFDVLFGKKTRACFQTQFTTDFMSILHDFCKKFITILNIFWKIFCKKELKFTKICGEMSLKTGSKLEYKLKSLTNHQKEISAIIDGGCVSVLCGNFGTKNQINWKNKILFLEDEGEDGERLDRYFYQIATIIKETKNKPAAILLGNFLQGNPHGTPKGKNIEIAIEKLTANLKEIAIYQEISNSLGHAKDMMPLILGTKAQISKTGILQQKI